MDARFRRLVLQHVDGALNKEHCREVLLDLLKIADPALSDETLDNGRKRQSAMRSLLALIHPDKHPNDLQRATERFQKAQIFYDSCCTVLKKGKDRKRALQHRRLFRLLSTCKTSGVFSTRMGTNQCYPQRQNHTPLSLRRLLLSASI